MRGVPVAEAVRVAGLDDLVLYRHRTLPYSKRQRIWDNLPGSAKLALAFGRWRGPHWWVVTAAVRARTGVVALCHSNAIAPLITAGLVEPFPAINYVPSGGPRPAYQMTRVGRTIRYRLYLAGVMA